MKYSEILFYLKIKKVDQTQRNCTQSDKWYSPGKQDICCWASKHLWAVVSTAASLTYGPRYPCWNTPLSSNKFSSSQFSLSLFGSFQSSDLTFKFVRGREVWLTFKTWTLLWSILVQCQHELDLADYMYICSCIHLYIYIKYIYIYTVHSLLCVPDKWLTPK